MQRVLVAGVLGGVTVYLWGWLSWTVLPWHQATMNKLPEGSAIAKNITSETLEAGVYQYPHSVDMEEAVMAELTEAEPEAATSAEEGQMNPQMAAEETGMEEAEESVATEESEMEMAETAAAEKVPIEKTEIPAPEAVVASTAGETVPAEKGAATPYLFIMSVPGGIDPQDPMPYVAGLILSILSATLAAYLVNMVSGSVGTFLHQVVFVALIGLFAGLVSHAAAWNYMSFPTDYTLVMILDLVISWTLGGIVIAWRVRSKETIAATA